MRTLLAIVMFVSGILPPSAGANAARKSMRSAKTPINAVQPRNFPRGDAVCERRARADDRTGEFAGFPCWARSAFGQGRK